nr:hypothetical protein [Tanacetum cinerariifolium]
MGAIPYHLLTLIIDHAIEKRCKQRAKAKSANSPLQLNGTAEVPLTIVLNTANATSAGATSDTPTKVAIDALEEEKNEEVKEEASKNETKIQVDAELT